MSDRTGRIDAQRFGPWALVTGASSGIGLEFARQLAANRINVVLAARRLPMLEQAGADLAHRYGVAYRAIGVDLAAPNFLEELVGGTDDLDLGLVVSNAGDMVLGEFLAADRTNLLRELRLNTEAHLQIAHHYGQRLVRRGSGGLVLVSSVAGIQGVPYIANYSATKAYTLMLGEAMHDELTTRGVHVTVLVPGATKTDMIVRFGANETAAGRMAMPVDVCVRGALAAVRANRAVHVSGRMNRTTIALIPRRARVRMFGAMNKSMAKRADAMPAHAGNVS